jgi:predicted secreted protein
MESSKILQMLFLMIIFCACAIQAVAASAPGPVVVTKDDNGKEITVLEGGIVEITMQYPAGTGYSWEITEIDKSRLEVLDTGTKPVQEGPTMGGPILKTWRIKAIGKGTTKLRMYYYRVWEGLEKAADKFEVTIRVT